MYRIELGLRCLEDIKVHIPQDKPYTGGPTLPYSTHGTDIIEKLRRREVSWTNMQIFLKPAAAYTGLSKIRLINRLHISQLLCSGPTKTLLCVPYAYEWYKLHPMSTIYILHMCTLSLSLSLSLCSLRPLPPRLFVPPSPLHASMYLVTVLPGGKRRPRYALLCTWRQTRS